MMGCSNNNEQFENNSPHDSSKVKPTVQKKKEEVNKYPDLDNNNIINFNERELPPIQGETDSNIINNKRKLPPINIENKDEEQIKPNYNLDMAPGPREEITFDCKYSKDDLNKKVEEFIQEIRDQNKFYKEKSADDDLYNKLKNDEEQILKEKYNSLKDNFLNEIIEQYTDELSSIEYQTITKEIIEYENGKLFLTNKIRKKILEIEKNVENFSVKHITILLVGKSGVGKSTLCNNLLRLPENKKALTDIGKPVTQKSNIYSDPNVNFLKVIDTAGIEIHGENKIENVIKVCKETIDKQVNSLDKNDMVSCIFYCFTGSRIEDEEIEFLDNLRKSLEGNTIPILYV